MNRRNLILLTGGTGYVGGRLLQCLENDGYAVRCMARRPETLRARVGKNTEVVFGDCFDTASLSTALAGVHTAYYLVHSMGAAGSFEEKDRRAASNFAEAAHAANVRRIIYLGGLGKGALSPHLRSRQEVGEALRTPGVEVIEFRAGAAVATKRVRDVEIEHQFRIAVISRGNVTFIPLPDTMLQPGDVLVGAVKEEGFARIERYMEG